MLKPSDFKYFYRLLLPALILVGGLILLAVAYWSESRAFFTAKKRMENTISYQAATLKASMDKYAILAVLIARRSDIAYALLTDDPLQELPKANELANFLAGISGAADVWIANREGTILVSNQFPEQTVDIYNEKYFQSALKGSMGRASVLAHSGKRLYLFASPVLSENHILGVVVVRVDLEYLEQVWALLQDPILVTDEFGRILLSNVEPWRFKFFYAGDVPRHFDEESNEYLVKNFKSHRRDRLTLNRELGDESGRDYVQVSQYDALLGWRIHTLTNYRSIEKQRNTVVFISLLVIALLSMSTFMFLNRQRRLLEEKRSQQAFALRLERQVRDRTHELTSSNEKLGVEIEERRLAEKQLREAQEELVQAAKLAGIGQMSTTLAHEYNQPLAAIRFYADNAIAFLSKENTEAAQDNLQRINMLVDKMANLTRTLRNFAHKASTDVEKISINSVMDEVIILLSPQAKKNGVKLNFNGESEPVFIMAEQGRLSQVITNLVTNAMDAVMKSENRRVDIDWHTKQSKAIIVVKDTGPGIDIETQDKMFNAFFTTKSMGSGLGLGLFIVMNIVKDLKGTLNLKNEEGYGAVFELTFPLV